MAKVLDVSESGYYKWQAQLSKGPCKRACEDVELIEEIHGIFVRSKGSYGSRKITRALNKNRENPVNHKRVERLMREYGLFSKTHKKFICTTDSKHDELIADNLIGRDFDAEAPNEKMVSDTTVVVTKEGKLYAAGIIDLYGRMPVGLALSRNNDKYLVIEA